MEAAWKQLRDAIYSSSTDALGLVKCKHQDWADENDSEISEILQRMHNTHKICINDKKCTTKKPSYLNAKSTIQLEAAPDERLMVG